MEHPCPVLLDLCPVTSLVKGLVSLIWEPVMFLSTCAVEYFLLSCRKKMFLISITVLSLMMF